MVAHGGRLPKDLFLFLKAMIYLNGAIAALAADVDLLGELAHVFEYFATTHGDRLAHELGLEQAEPLDIGAMQDRMRKQMGVTTETVTFRELQARQADRMEELRTARRHH
jgi:ubiquinone biosynthesis protein